MPPSLRQPTLAEVVELLHGLQSSMDKVNNRVESLCIKMEEVTMKVSDQERKIDDVKMAINNLEQRNRNSSIRVFGLEVDDPTSKCALLTAKLVFNVVIKPILEVAVSKGELQAVPEIFNVIEYAHVIPNKKTSTTPIIIRLQSRIYRTCIFRHKKAVLSSDDSLNTVFINEDLTTENYRKLQEVKQLPTTLKAWTVSGRIRLTTKEEPDRARYYSEKTPTNPASRRASEEQSPRH